MIEEPDLSAVPTSDLIVMLRSCGISDDQSDKEFAKFCRDEIARRKPSSAAKDCSQPEKT